MVHGRKVPVTEMTQKIEKVTVHDIRRAAARFFGPGSGRKPTMVVMGHEDVGSYGDVFSKYGLGAP